MLFAASISNNLFSSKTLPNLPNSSINDRALKLYKRQINFSKKIFMESGNNINPKKNVLNSVAGKKLEKLAFLSDNILPVFGSKFSKKSLSQKLSQVPVFAVTNATGQPYLANNSNGEQIGLIFFSQEDALSMLKSMQKSHQALEARIYIMGLDKAYRMVLSNASPSGIQGNLGQELKMVFRFYPDQKEVKNANNLKKNLNPIDNFKGVPVFLADGLTIRKGREEITPIFLTKEDLDEAWSTMCKFNPDQPIKPVVRVTSLLELISRMENEPEDFSSFGFFPPTKSVDFVKRENSNNPSARIMPGLFQKI